TRIIAGSAGADCTNSSVNPFGTNDTIIFDPAFFNTARIITLNGTQLPIIDRTLVISNTTGNGITVSGNFLSRIFQVAGATAKTVSISNLHLTAGHLTSGANDGGAILVQNANTILFLSNMVFFGNVTLAGNGGALANQGS